MKQLPNILTLINLFSGVGMIMFILMGEMYPALILMVVALFMDVMDGRVAYWLKAQSELGKQLDSLADMVSFGVVPGVMMASMINEALGLPFPPSSIEMTYQSPLYAVGFLIPVFAALRLAKFKEFLSLKTAYPKSEESFIIMLLCAGSPKICCKARQ